MAAPHCVDVDVPGEIASLKKEGNELFGRKEYAGALTKYSDALELDSSNSVLLCNRSACYLALNEVADAINDSRAAIKLDQLYVKAYYRLVQGLIANKEYREAISVAEKGLEQDPTNLSLQKSKEHAEMACRKLLAKGKGLHPKVSPKRGFLLDESASLVRYCCPQHTEMDQYCGDCTNNAIDPQSSSSSSGNGDAKNGGTAPSQEEVNLIDARMHAYLKKFVADIISTDLPLSSIQNVPSEGEFAKLLTRSGFADTLFPGMSEQHLQKLPCNLRELLKQINDSLDLRKVAQTSCRIFEGVKKKGSLVGETMDEFTEVVVSQQIAQEALGREIISMMRDFAKQLNTIKAQVLTLPLADPKLCPDLDVDDLCQLDSDLAAFTNNFSLNSASMQDRDDFEVARSSMSPDSVVLVQDEFLGDEWASLAYEDALRFLSAERMTSIGHNANTTRADGSTSRGAAMAWVELKSLQSSYPTLAETVKQLHTLPFEVNEKSAYAWNLLQATEGNTLLVHYPTGASQNLRIDNKISGRWGDSVGTAATDAGDSGVRISFVYSFASHADDAGSSDDDGAELSVMQWSAVDKRSDHAVNSGIGGDAGTEIGDLDASCTCLVLNDQLIMHKAAEVRHARTPAQRPYFALYFFAQMRLNANTR